jgi:hypothetical protein
MKNLKEVLSSIREEAKPDPVPLWLTAKSNGGIPVQTGYGKMGEQLHDWIEFMPVISTVPLESGSPIANPNKRFDHIPDIELDHYELKDGNIYVWTGEKTELDIWGLMSSIEHDNWPIVYVDLTDNSVKVVSHIQYNTSSEMNVYNRTNGSVNVNNHRSLRFQLCSLDPLVFPNGAMDLTKIRFL